jgi:hypothetical protein
VVVGGAAGVVAIVADGVAVTLTVAVVCTETD